ncbi:terpenoid cyclases/protein prenyltransferase alpha-alpha toroid [Amanita rubescens]|nr:terpenoid cyclases/protein prenyltransferase alpha-alpha toroid [Amanita rubescens]
MIDHSTKLRPSPADGYPTITSIFQAETESVLQEYIPDASFTPKPLLEKRPHMQFLIRNLVQGFPTRYTSQDASQPWLLFWTLQSFSILQVGLDPGNKQRSIDKILTWQHPEGGFGGGPGQAAHLLPTYAAVCALAIVGRPGQNGGWDQINREKMHGFFMSLKQKDGSFLVTKHGEVDVRGIYCLIVTAILLDILTPELVEGTAEFIASCQTYEGGFSSSSQPYFSAGPTPSLLTWPRPAMGEAHGGYTFCSLASWVALQPVLNHSQSTSASIDLPNLVRWLAHMQGNEIEIGGFRGRTNKLVDGCYSWWCGGSFPLLEALGVHANAGLTADHHDKGSTIPTATDIPDEIWDDLDGMDSLYDREALQQYLLYACQHPTGGLRDKPPKNPDSYHTLYCLSGLSSAQHRVVPSPARRSELISCWKQNSRAFSLGTGTNEDLRREVFLSILDWTEDETSTNIVGGRANRVNATHPITNLTISHTEGIMAHFYGQTIPPRRKVGTF